MTISSSKAKELGVKTGDHVVVIGRRRKAAYAVVNVAKKGSGKKGSCKVSSNLAQNLKIRNDDKIKIVTLEADVANESRSGDLLLLVKAEVPTVESVTFSPIEDTLMALVAAVGGDDIPDEEIQARFVQPYMEDFDGAVIKQGHVVKLTDENGKKLEFIVTHLEVSGGEDTEEADDGT